MRGYFKMVHFAIRQFNITAVLIILQTGNIRNAMSTGKEAHLLIEGGWGNILMHPDTSVGARNEVKLYE